MTARKTWLVCLAAGVIAAALSGLILRHAIWMAADSWAFWQGSVSLLNGEGYRLFGYSDSIKEWPPLYPAYLAAWQAVFGVSGKTLIASQVFLAGLSAFGWTRLSLTLLDGPMGSRSESWIAPAVVAAFVALFVATRYDCIRADNLKYTVLPALIAVGERTWRASSWAESLRLCAGLGVIGAVLLLVHTSSIAFVCAAVLVVLLARSLRPTSRLLGALVVGALAVVPPIVSRAHLQQGGSHTVGFGIAEYGPVEYAIQALGGSTTLLLKQPWLSAPLAIGLAIAAWRVFSKERVSERTLNALEVRTVFVAGSLFVSFCLFNLTYVTDKLTGRFLFFVPLTLVPIAVAVLAAGERRRLFLAASALVVLAGMPRLLGLAGGVESSREGRTARPEQFANARDCIQRPGVAPSWTCSAGTTPRVPPPWTPFPTGRGERANGTRIAEAR